MCYFSGNLRHNGKFDRKSFLNRCKNRNLSNVFSYIIKLIILEKTKIKN